VAACYFCESEDNLTICPGCEKQVCFDDLHYVAAAKQEICLGCYVGALDETNGNGLHAIAPVLETIDTPLDAKGHNKSGKAWTPTPPALERINEFSMRAKGLTLVQLNQLVKKCDEKTELVAQLLEFRRLLRNSIEYEFHKRFTTAKKKRAAKYAVREEKARKERKATPKSKLNNIAAMLAKAGWTPEKLAALIKK
jgi:hypothetical protein